MKPISLKEWVEKNCPEQKRLIKDALRVQREYDKYFGSRCCDICDKELTPQELNNNLTPFHFLKCCDEHLKYSEWFDREKARRDAGITYEPTYEIFE